MQHDWEWDRVLLWNRCRRCHRLDEGIETCPVRLWSDLEPVGAIVVQNGGPDHCFVRFSETVGKVVHGKYHESFPGAFELKFDTAAGRGSAALVALGLDLETIEVVMGSGAFK